MLESISYYRRMGEDDEAASMCEAIIGDFGGLAGSEDLDAEGELALRHLSEAIEIYMDLRDDVSSGIVAAGCSSSHWNDMLRRERGSPRVAAAP